VTRLHEDYTRYAFRTDVTRREATDAQRAKLLLRQKPAEMSLSKCKSGSGGSAEIMELRVNGDGSERAL